MCKQCLKHVCSTSVAKYSTIIRLDGLAICNSDFCLEA